MGRRPADQFAKRRFESKAVSGASGCDSTGAAKAKQQTGSVESIGRTVENSKAMARKKANVAAQQGGQLDTRDYVYSVVWSEEDQAYIGRVLEFPSLAAHGNTQAKALNEIRSVVQHALDDLTRSGEEVPEPLNKRAYSGKLNVRLPKYLHRQLAIEAAEEGVSLNQLISTKLATTRWLSQKPRASKSSLKQRRTRQGLKTVRRPQRNT